MNENYDRRMQAMMEGLKREGKRPRLLLHSCCAPCSTAVLKRLAEGFDITVFYYNPTSTPGRSTICARRNWRVLWETAAWRWVP